MKRWRLTALSLGVAALLAGCGGPKPPAGVDGDLANGWAVIAEPLAYEPKVGACIATTDSDLTGIVTRRHDRVVACQEKHQVQIVGVGAFGEDGATPKALLDAYYECDRMAAAFLKEDWRNGLLAIGVARAKSAEAKDGARWWECDLFDASTGRGFYGLTTDLAQGIPADLRYTCEGMTLKGGVITDVYPTDCAKPHNAEYAGAVVFPVGTPFPTSPSQWTTIHEGCRPVVARYIGAPPNTVAIYSAPMRDSGGWPNLRDVRCYAYFGNKTMTGSAKGTGGRGVPWY